MSSLLTFVVVGGPYSVYNYVHVHGGCSVLCHVGCVMSLREVCVVCD